jgi:hypothetical protein
MSKFNAHAVRARAHSPLGTQTVADGRTHEGHPGYARDVRSELFLLAVSNMVGEDTFYESAADRDARYTELVRRATVQDPEWTAALLGWLRSDGNLRSASLVGAAEFTKARLDAGAHGMSRQVVDSVLRRADEPGELLAYWTSTYGRALPKPVKRGVADAVARLYDERALLKYDAPGRGFRFGDVLELVHAENRTDWQGDLFRHAISRRHDRADEIPASLAVLRARAELMALPVDQRRAVLADPERLQAAGMTWESLAGWLQGPMDGAAWEAIIPSMGVMALLRNLRNFDQAGVGDAVAETVAARLADPAQVARSRQLPYRWFSAYRELSSDRWRVALGAALDAATGNLPEIPGRTLILVDTSASMTSGGLSARSKIRPVDSAALFGVALGMRCGPASVDLVGYASGTFRHELAVGDSVLRQVERFTGRVGEVGHGTETAGALRASYAGQDRVVILSDEQAFASHHGEVSDQVPAQVPVYAFNLGGYRHGMQPGRPNRHQLGGLTDHTFRMIPLLEAGRDGAWPWAG